MTHTLLSKQRATVTWILAPARTSCECGIDDLGCESQHCDRRTVERAEDSCNVVGASLSRGLRRPWGVRCAASVHWRASACALGVRSVCKTFANPPKTEDLSQISTVSPMKRLSARAGEHEQAGANTPELGHSCGSPRHSHLRGGSTVGRAHPNASYSSYVERLAGLVRDACFHARGGVRANA